MEVQKTLTDYICKYIHSHRDFVVSVLGEGNESIMILIYKDAIQSEFDNITIEAESVALATLRENKNKKLKDLISCLGRSIPTIIIGDTIVISYGKQFTIDYTEPDCFKKLDKILLHLIEFDNLNDYVI